MISCRIHHIGHLLLFTLALLTLTPTLTSASVFGPDPIANSPAPALVARNLKPTKRQATGNPTTSQGFGRRSKKNVIPAAEKQKKDYSAFLCPAGSVSCPAISDGMRALDGRELRQLNAKEMNAQLNSLADWFKIGFECVQVESEMSNCGGCAQLGNGRNCSSISDAISTTCDSGSCKITQCAEGFTVSADKKSCISRPGPAGGIGGFQFDDEEEELILMRR